MSARLKPHPAAEILPMLSELELAKLQEKFVAAREQLVPAVTLDGKILDGRNREEICHRLGWTLKTITWQEWLERNEVSLVPPPTPTEWVLSMNVDRRHMNESQRAVAAAKALPLLEAEARKRMSAGGKKEKGGPRGPPLPAVEEWPPAGARATADRDGKPEKKGRARDQAAKATGASPRSVQRAKAVIEKRPDLATLIEQGRKTLGQVEKSIKKEAALKNVLEYVPPKGTYSVIVADPSWKYKDQLDGSDQARGGTNYPPMELEEICAMQVGKKNAAGDCALWLWVTKDHLLDGSAGKVLDAWGFEGKQIYTWRKVDSKGNDRMGSGHYGRNVTEFVILATRGKPLVAASDQVNIFDAPRGAHSAKPDRAFEIFEKVTPCAPEARIELFAVKASRTGWQVSGSEQQAKVRGKLSPAQRAELAAQVREPTEIKDGIDLRVMGTADPALLARGWAVESNGYVKTIAGNAWFVDQPNGSRSWEAYMPAQNGLRARTCAGRFVSAEVAANQAEWEGERIKPAVHAEVPDDGSRCGIRPSKNGDGCIHKQGHDGVHSNGRTTWTVKGGKTRRENMRPRDVEAST